MHQTCGQQPAFARWLASEFPTTAPGNFVISRGKYPILTAGTHVCVYCSHVPPALIHCTKQVACHLAAGSSSPSRSTAQFSAFVFSSESIVVLKRGRCWSMTTGYLSRDSYHCMIEPICKKYEMLAHCQRRSGAWSFPGRWNEDEVAFAGPAFLARIGKSSLGRP